MSAYQRLKQIGILINTANVKVAVCAGLSDDDLCKKDLKDAEGLLDDAMHLLAGLRQDFKGSEKL